MATTPQSPVAYPLAIKKFKAHQNLIEDVDASHVNDLQNEVAVMQTILGTNPHQDATLVNTYKNGKPLNKWKTVAERLNFIQRRQDLPVIDLYRSAVQTFLTDQPTTVASTRVVFPAPSIDTHGMFNGSTGIKVKRPGYYLFIGAIHFADSPLKGVRELAITKNGGAMVRSTSPMWDTGTGKLQWGSDIYLNCSIMALVTPKDVISLNVNLDTEQYANGKFSAVRAHLQGFMIRDI